MNLEFANKLQKLRKEKGYSQEELAQELGISRQAVSKWERAEASPDTDNLICLAKLYNISIDYLLSNDSTIEKIKVEQMNEQKETDEEENNYPRILNVISGAIPISIVIIYIILGSFWGLWHPGWLIFLLIPILFSIIDVIGKKNIVCFNYPVLVALVYLFLGFVLNLWHPWWFLFITIPLFYIIVDGVNKALGKKIDNED